MVRGGGIIILASRRRWQQHSARGIILLASRWQQHSAGASSSLPVVGGNQTPHGIMSDWDVNGMVSLLESISLGHLSKAFIENGLDGAFSSSARRRSWPALVLPHCSSRKSWPTRRVGRKINEPAVGGSLPSSRWRFSSLAWPALAENAHTCGA